MKMLQQELKQKLAAVKPAIPSNLATPVLKGVLVKDNKLTAYNLEYGITTTLDSHVDQPFILPAETISVIESLPEGEMEIVVESGNVLKIIAGNIVHKVSSQPSGDFPELPKITVDDHIVIDAGTLMEGIEAVIYAVSNSSEKPVQRGVLFEADKNDLNLAACDGHRLVWFKTKMQGRFRFIIPGDALEKLLKLKMEGKVQLAFGKRHAVFSTESSSIVIRLLEEADRFIDYQETVPKNEHLISTDRKKLLDCLHRALLCVNDMKKNAQGKIYKCIAPVVLTAAQDESVMKVSARNYLSEYSETLPLNEPATQDLRIGFNAKYLAEAIQHCDGDTVEMYVGSPARPLLICDGDIISLVTPVNPKAY